MSGRKILHPLLNRFSGYMIGPVLQVMIALATIPIKTYFLGPSDFGNFALVLSLTTFCAIIAPLGSSYIITQKYLIGSREEAKTLVNSLLILSIFNCLILSAILFLSFLILQENIDFLNSIDINALLISIFSIPFTVFWIFSTEVTTIQGNSQSFAYSAIAQSLISLIFLLLALYVFDYVHLSLYISQTAGAVAGGIVGWLSLKPYRGNSINFKDVKRAFTSGPAIVFSNATESFLRIFENNVIGVRLGASELGLFAHSQQYRNMTLMPLKAVLRTIWPISLKEAQTTKSMDKTRGYWVCSSFAILILALGFYVVGDPVVNFITNDRFHGVSVLILIWLAVLIVQNSGRSQTAILWASGEGAFSAWSFSVSTIISMTLLIPTVNFVGIYGVFLCILLQQIIHIQFLSRKTRTILGVFSNDKIHFLGAILIASIELMAQFFSFGIVVRLVIATVTTGVVLSYFRLSEPRLWEEGKSGVRRLMSIWS